jgi:hypothetical protein
MEYKGPSLLYMLYTRSHLLAQLDGPDLHNEYIREICDVYAYHNIFSFLMDAQYIHMSVYLAFVEYYLQLDDVDNLNLDSL